jgi:hypothetical protein
LLIDFSAPLLTLKGTELKEHGETVNFGTVLCNLMAAQPSEAGLPVSERRKRFVLSVRIVQASCPIDVDDADVALMTKLVNASSLPPLFSEQITCALEGKPNPLRARGAAAR